jgi:hypothetical protein
LVPDGLTANEIEATIRAVVKDFLESGEARVAVEYAGGDFNWGDALCFVPDEFFSKYGVIPVAEHSLTVKVNQDEVLYPELQKRFLS